MSEDAVTIVRVYSSGERTGQRQVIPARYIDGVRVDEWIDAALATLPWPEQPEPRVNTITHKRWQSAEYQWQAAQYRKAVRDRRWPS